MEIHGHARWKLEIYHNLLQKLTPNFQDPRLIIGQMCQRRASLSQGQHCRIFHVFAQKSHLLTLDPKFLKAKNDR